MVFAILGISLGTDPRSRSYDRRADASDHDRSRSRSGQREVDQYLRSMTKIKPNWSDEKILRSAKSIYGPDRVPYAIPSAVRYGAPTESAEVAGATASHDVEQGMTTDQIKWAIYAIRDKYPKWNTETVLEQFKKEYPMEPNPPSISMVKNYLFYQKVEERASWIPDGISWSRLSEVTKRNLRQQGRDIMRRRYLENRSKRWDELVYETMVEFYRIHQIKLSPVMAYGWYNEVRKEAPSHA